MTVLLDTHVFLWLQVSPDRVRNQVRRTLEDPRTDIVVSAVSAWEMAIKSQLGRLDLPEAVEDYVPSRMRTMAARELPVDHRDALAVARLPMHHRDPFDRLLVAQALRHELTLVTADTAIGRYDVPVLWAEGTYETGGTSA